MSTLFLSRLAACVTFTFLVLGTALAVEPDTFSRVVSFQFQESMADPATSTPIQSKVVSFQYFDWPGDENFTFQNGPAVSFFFKDSNNLAFMGKVSTDGGASVPGAVVSLKRSATLFWQGTTDASGMFYAPGLSAQNYALVVQKDGYRTLTTSVAGAAGGLGTVQLYLAALPAASQCINVARGPVLSALGVTPAGSSLRAFSGGHFVNGVSLIPGRATIVLTHGWLSRPEDWAFDMAQKITAQFSEANVPNIVAWDWHEAASGGYLDSAGVLRYLSIVGKIDIAAKEGLNLGMALQQALGTDYAQHVHFVGHSLGTIVNRYACDYVHASFPAGSRSSMNSPTRWSKTLTAPHVTLLDEAELASVVGTRAITSTVVATALGVSPAEALLLSEAANWKSPLPTAARWVDSYISAVGIQHNAAVNVCLPWKSATSLNPAAAHAYAYEWYAMSVTASGAQAPAVGFGRSLEKALTFPPTGTGMSAGSLWLQSTATPDSLVLVLDPNPYFGEASSLIAASYAVQYGTKVKEGAGIAASAVVQLGESAAAGLASGANTYLVQPADNVGRAVMSGYMTGIEAAGNVGGTVIYKTGLVVSETKEKVGRLLDASADYAVNALDHIQPDSVQVGPITIPFMRIRLTTQAAPQGLNHADATGPKIAAMAAPTGQPAYAWMTVHVPDNAGFLAFDFTITGQPNEDRIVCSINDMNVFNLPAKFAPDNVPSSTDQIDVSSFAGQDIELMFGLTGGTSTNCELAIDGIRFTTIPMPKVGLLDMGANVGIKWPAAATGWVLESSDTLAPGSWQTVPAPNGVAVDSGVVTLQQPNTAVRRFFRLRLVQ